MTAEPTMLHWETVHPYVSVTVLECTAEDLAAAFDRLRTQLLVPGPRRAGRRLEVVAVSDGAGDGVVVGPEGDVDQLAGFVRRQRNAPAWAGEDAGFEDTVHHLTVALRRRRLIAVHCDSTTQNRLQRWLDKAPKPPFTRIPPGVLEGALHRGDAKSLWLRGVHQPRTTKPDIKNTGGTRLQDTINPSDDGTFAVGAARSELPESPHCSLLKGIVGSTPGESSVWFKASPNFPTFVQMVTELFGLIENEFANGTGEEAFPHFAHEVYDLSVVSGAYAVRVVHAEHLPPGVSEEVVEAAAILEDAVLDVTAQPGSSRFFLDVGLDGKISGRMRATPKACDTRFALDIGYAECATDPATAARVLDALQHADDLLSIYYSSGHTLTHGRIWAESPRDFPFPNFSFQDFTGYDIAREKPPHRDSQSIHDATGLPGDRSLFGWVVNKYSDGWLICDDGPGEVADFVHVSPQGQLSLIHVKAARNAASNRQVALGPFEVVVSQAVKNLAFAQRDRLHDRLSTAHIARPASWDLGERAGSRAEFLDALETLDATSRTEIVIVQPHLSRAIHDRLKAKSAAVTEDLLRLRLLDELLNSARSTVTGAATDLVVIGSLV